jgi:DNA replication protein DnaC
MIERNVGFAILKLTPFEPPFGIEGLKLSNQIPEGRKQNAQSATVQLHSNRAHRVYGKKIQQLSRQTGHCKNTIKKLIEARDEKLLSRAVKRYAGYGLLIIDELGYVPFSKEGAQLIFQILTECHEQRPVMITTNMGFGDWTQIFGDPSMTAALLDRITHKAHVINCSWQSYRLKETLKSK